LYFTDNTVVSKSSSTSFTPLTNAIFFSILSLHIGYRISDFLSDNWEQVQDDYNNLEAKDRLVFYEKLLQYDLPRLQATEFTNTSNLEKLSDKDLDILIEKLKQDMEYERV